MQKLRVKKNEYMKMVDDKVTVWGKGFSTVELCDNLLNGIQIFLSVGWIMLPNALMHQIIKHLVCLISPIN